MRVLQKQRSFFLTSCILVFFLSMTLMSCGKKPTYEGGNIAFSYDEDRWELSYADTEPDLTFNLQSDENSIIIMMIEGDDTVVDAFHEEMVKLLQTDYEVTEKGKTDQWDSQSWCYYEDIVNADEAETMITYAKELDGKILVGFSEISLSGSEEKNEADVNEVLDIFNSVECSDKAEAGDIVQAEDNSFAEYLYNDLNVILDFEVAADDGSTDTKEKQNENTNDTISDEESSKLNYVEKVVMEDFEGNESQYYTYAPIGNSGCTEGFVSCWEYGLNYTAFLYDKVGTTTSLYASLEESVNTSLEMWNDKEYGYDNVQAGEIQKNGDDRYQIITAQKEDYNEIPYEVKKISYMDVCNEGDGILWEMEISEIDMNSETPLVIEELAKCYGIDPDELQINGEWAAKNAEHSVNQQDVYDPAEEENPLEKVDGYEYLGLATLTSYSLDKDVKCPVLIPMGWETYIGDAYATSSLHGIYISGSVEWIIAGDFEAISDECVTSRFKELTRSDAHTSDRYRNVWKSEKILLPEYNKGACYYVFTYEDSGYINDEYMPMTEVLCMIRINDEYFLSYTITLSEEEYDTATNAVLKELEGAYGIDLSEYYCE